MAGRSKPAVPEALVATTAIVASAVRYPGKVPRIFHTTEQWQRDAYRFYRIIGEARYAANYMGNSLSRAKLYAADPTGEEMVRAAADSESARIMAELFGGPDGQAGMLKSVGVHMTVAGECYLVGRKPTGIIERDRGSVAETIWEIVSGTEINTQGDNWIIDYGDGHLPVSLDDDDVVIRIWTPDPERRMQADSPFKSALPVLKEIEYLTLHIFAQCRSRLSGAGILWVPSEMDFPPAPIDPATGEPFPTNTEAEGLMMALADAMVTDNYDAGDPNQTVPIALSAPGEQIDKAQLMHFWSDLDEKALEMRSAAVHRFALGMDLPPEQILGMSSNSGAGGGTSNGISHWGQWQVDESTIKLHIEPMLDALISALTISYLRPGGAINSVVLYDTSALRLRPDRSAEAIVLYNLGLLKAEVVIRENGFDLKDMPDEEERKTWLLLKVATGSATPDQVHAALKTFGIDLGPAPSTVNQGDPDLGVRETRPDPSTDDIETRREPERDRPVLLPVADAHDTVLLNVAHSMVYRALERAGNRIRRTHGAPVNCPAWQTHTMVRADKAAAVLGDAFANADLILDGIAEASLVVPVLEAYAQTLINEQSNHDKARLEQWLAQARLIEAA